MGNICRSPTAEGIFRALVEEHGLSDKISCDSAGTHAYHIGKSPHEISQQVAAAHGIDISKLKARRVEDTDFIEFDNLVVMDDYNVSCLQERAFSGHESKIELLTSYLSDEYDYNCIPDPYTQSQNGFEEVYQLIELSCRYLLRNIQD
jgi:protein-tyrosine phosphatase